MPFDPPRESPAPWPPAAGKWAYTVDETIPSLLWTLAASQPLRLQTGDAMNDNAICPQCGSELLRSPLYPHGSDSGGAIRKARICNKQGLSFGQASDGSWSISVAPLNINHTSVSQGRA